jgi:hypothetical protein
VSTKIGRAGEFLAAYILESFGVEVHHVSRDGADLWCKVRGSLTTVQVKAASYPRTEAKGRKLQYGFFVRPVEVEWYCFIALDKRLLLMRPDAEVLTKTVRIDPAEFSEDNQRRTIEQFIESC